MMEDQIPVTRNQNGVPDAGSSEPSGSESIAIPNGASSTMRESETSADAPSANAAPSKPAANDRWEGLRVTMRERQSIPARVIKWQRNGLEVELEDGTAAFMPNDMIDRDPNRNVANYFGKTVPVKVTSVRAKMGGTQADIVVSHRAVIEEELRNAGREAIKQFNVGDIVEGKVKSFSKDDVLIDLGAGIDAVIRLRDLSWQQVDHPYELIKRGETVQAKILGLDRGRRRVQLGVRQLTSDPELEKYKEFSSNQIVKGKVITTGHYGAELELSNGLVAFLPMSEIAWERLNAVTDVVNVGDEVEVKLLKVDADDRRITSSRKLLIENPLKIMESTFRPGTDHDGTIKEVNRGGVVVALPHGAEGFVPRRELSHDRIERLEDSFKAGKKLEGLRVIEYDDRNGDDRPGSRGPRITLSLIAAEKEAQHNTLKDYRATSKASRYSLADSLSALKEQLQKQEQGH